MAAAPHLWDLKLEVLDEVDLRLRGIVDVAPEHRRLGSEVSVALIRGR
jgi:hypothetical protein